MLYSNLPYAPIKLPCHKADIFFSLIELNSLLGASHLVDYISVYNMPRACLLNRSPYPSMDLKAIDQACDVTCQLNLP